MEPRRWTAFHGVRQCSRADVSRLLLDEQWRDGDPKDPSLMIFDDVTGRVIDVDLRLPVDDILAALDASLMQTPADDSAAAPQPQGRGRPRLGVVAREVTLLPRHWEWLASRPGGASVALRKLVDEARRAGEGEDRIKRAQEAAYRFMHALAGDRAGYEDALRALYARDALRFDALTADWPEDVRACARRLAGPAFGDGERAAA